MTWLQNHESLLRIVCFLCLLTLFAWLERRAPRRQRRSDMTSLVANLSMPVIGTVAARALLPLAPVAVSLLAADAGIGLLNLLEVATWLAALISFFLLDMAIYWQHRLMHRVPLLWRLHRMHHSDTHVDVTTGVRFHPAEILLSLAFKCALVLALGAPAIAVLAFELVLSSASLFNHSNLALSTGWDQRIRWLLVTPDMHRVHHSICVDETDSNFSFSFSFWDRLFSTYKAQPIAPHQSMSLGLDQFRESKDQTTMALLRQPINK
ncbi:MAG: sterol desaturase family protein [Pseudomonadota bacterium]